MQEDNTYKKQSISIKSNLKVYPAGSPLIVVYYKETVKILGYADFNYIPIEFVDYVTFTYPHLKIIKDSFDI